MIQFTHYLSAIELLITELLIWQNALLDLLVESDGPIDIIPPPSQKTITNTTNSTTTNDLLDLLGGIDFISPTNTDINTNGNSILASMTSPHLNNLQSPLGLSLSSAGADTTNFVDEFTNDALALNGVNLLALDKNGLHVVLVPQPSPIGDNNRCLRVIMTATNNSLSTMEQYLFQAAVPKSFTLQMLSPSGSVLPPGGVITQEMRLTSSAKVSYFTNPFLFFYKPTFHADSFQFQSLGHPSYETSDFIHSRCWSNIGTNRSNWFPRWCIWLRIQKPMSNVPYFFVFNVNLMKAVNFWGCLIVFVCWESERTIADGHLIMNYGGREYEKSNVSEKYDIYKTDKMQRNYSL